MKITDIHRTTIEACCRFTYKGVEISASTIFGPPNSVIVVDRRISDDTIYEATSIEDAIGWINNNTYQPA